MSIENRIERLERRSKHEGFDYLEFIILRGDNYPGPLAEFECRKSDLLPQKPNVLRFLCDFSRYD